MAEQTRLSPKRAAQLAGVSASLVYQWCVERRLAHYRVGTAGRRGRILIDPADLERLMRECRREVHPLLGEDG
jgi:excisionase family DNA binding protein